MLGLADLAQWLAPRSALAEHKEKGDELFAVNQGWIQNPQKSLEVLPLASLSFPPGWNRQRDGRKWNTVIISHTDGFCCCKW